MDTFTNFNYLKLYPFNFETYTKHINFKIIYTLKKRIKIMFLAIFYLKYTFLLHYNDIL